MLRLMLLVLVLSVAHLTAATASHPYAEWTAMVPDTSVMGSFGDGMQGQLSGEADIHDLTFHAPHPPADTLSNAERYMLWGATDPQTGTGVQAWLMIVYPAIWAHQSRHGYLPARLTPEALRGCLGGTYADEALDMFRNPITGEWPRLNAAEHSPGDLYCRALTAEEIAWFGQYDDRLRSIADHSIYARGEGPVNASMLIGPLYVRLYGHETVILSRIMTAWWVP